MNILLFTGAGASVELGVPGMRQLAREFGTHLADVGTPQALLDAYEERLQEDDFDFEDLIDELDKLAATSRLATIWKVDADTHSFEQFQVVRNEAEWFVQHACERIDPELARQMWRPTLISVAEHTLCIATTNYDRAVEIAARDAGVTVNDGFGAFGNSEFALWNNFARTEPIHLVKMHGSTDWYRARGVNDVPQQVVKLRHPMALFGDITINDRERVLENAIILPAREKRTVEDPFRKLQYIFERAAEEAEIAIFLGTSLRDDHIFGVAAECSERIATAVVSPDEHPRLPPGATKVNQSASQFLVSTLPRAMAVPTKDEFVQVLRQESGWSKTVLDDLSASRNRLLRTEDRCAAIDRLCEARMSLDEPAIEYLLEDPDADIRKYALALIPDSRDRASALAKARLIGDSIEDAEFKNELELLIQLNSPEHPKVDAKTS